MHYLREEDLCRYQCYYDLQHIAHQKRYSIYDSFRMKSPQTFPEIIIVR